MLSQAVAQKVALLTGMFILAFGFTSSGSAQKVSSFMMDRYINAGAGTFETFYVEETRSMPAALDSNLLAGNHHAHSN